MKFFIILFLPLLCFGQLMPTSVLPKGDLCLSPVDNTDKISLQIPAKEIKNSAQEILSALKTSDAKNSKQFKKLAVAIDKMDSKINNIDTFIKRQLYVMSELILLVKEFKKDDPDYTDLNEKITFSTIQLNQLECNKNDFKIINLDSNVIFSAVKIDVDPNDYRIYPFTESCARIKFRNKFGFINAEGKIVCNPKFDSLGIFKEGLAVYHNNDDWGYIDTSGRIVKRFYDLLEAHDFNNGYAVVKYDNPNNAKWNYLNKSWEPISKKNFYYAYDFSFGLGCVQLNVPLTEDEFDNVVRIGPFNPFILDEEFRSQSFKLLTALKILKDRFKRSEIRSFADAYLHTSSYNSEFLVKNKYYSLFDYFVNHEEYNFKFGYIDTNGTFRINPEFDIAFPFELPNVARVGNNQNYELLYSTENRDMVYGLDSGFILRSFLIDSLGMEKSVVSILANYTDSAFSKEITTKVLLEDCFPISNFLNNHATSHQLLIDTSGLILVSLKNDINFHDRLNDFYIVKDYSGDFLTGLVNSDGLEILPLKYDSIIFMDKDIVKATANGIDKYFKVFHNGNCKCLKGCSNKL